jgi:hypothetical protein
MKISDRETLLRNLLVGDIFHATSPSGASLICLTTKVDDNVIEARTVTTQKTLRFDRRTGTGEWESEQITCVIDSVAPLPIEIHNVMLGLDRKFRLTQLLEGLKLSDVEQNALLFIDSFYPENQL